jgi:hypothetical protein
MNNWHPSLWLVNGQTYPGTANVSVPAGQRVLLRYLNAGIDNNTMTVLGLHERMLAQDAYPLTNPFDFVAETFASGQTGDALVQVPAGTASGTRYPLYNRNLQMGMFTYLTVP